MTAGPETQLFAMLAEITGGMMKIRELLAANPAVTRATRGCDLQRYRGTMDPETLSFESYVEADTHSGKTFVWSLDVNLTPTAWTVDRIVAEQISEGWDNQRDFDDAIFDSFDAMAGRFPALIAEFIESARDFAFGR